MMTPWQLGDHKQINNKEELGQKIQKTQQSTKDLAEQHKRWTLRL